MVTKRIEVENQVCDLCENDFAYYSCGICKKDICGSCSREKCRILPCEVWCDSSRDMILCSDCHNRSWPTKEENPLLHAFLKVRTLRMEYNSWVTEFKVRKEKAEQEVKRLLEKENR